MCRGRREEVGRRGGGRETVAAIVISAKRHKVSFDTGGDGGSSLLPRTPEDRRRADGDNRCQSKHNALSLSRTHTHTHPVVVHCAPLSPVRVMILLYLHDFSYIDLDQEEASPVGGPPILAPRPTRLLLCLRVHVCKIPAPCVST